MILKSISIKKVAIVKMSVRGGIVHCFTAACKNRCIVVTEVQATHTK